MFCGSRLPSRGSKEVQQPVSAQLDTHVIITVATGKDDAPVNRLLPRDDDDF